MPKWIEEMAVGAVFIFGAIFAGEIWRRNRAKERGEHDST
jgi:hypothetical protein